MSLFRGKRVGERQWKYGSYVEQYGATQIYLKNGADEDGFDCYHVEPETVGQYAELTDKNRKEIFKGDIVKTLDGQVGIVTYEFGAFGIGMIAGKDYECLDSIIKEITSCDTCNYFHNSDNFISLYELMWNYYNQVNDDCCDIVEVIGNIYDNPELIKEINK
jgi:uncharacterized phage protein (TIGR01671 family)